MWSEAIYEDLNTIVVDLLSQDSEYAYVHTAMGVYRGKEWTTNDIVQCRTVGPLFCFSATQEIIQ